jgi:hypothetical protein
MTTILNRLCPDWRTGQGFDVSLTGADYATLERFAKSQNLRFQHNGNYGFFDLIRDEDDRPV